MTISLAARDPLTGAFGMVISSSSVAVASRCLHLRSGVGAAASQNLTNPALGALMLDALADGADAETAVGLALAADKSPAHRQLAVVDSVGCVAHYSGVQVLGIHAFAIGRQAVATGNMLVATEVAQAMVHAYESSPSAAFEERLFDGFRAAVAAGGETSRLRSAGLAVVEQAAWPVTDLRVDDADDPGAELARLLALWLPQKQDYLMRALDPAAAPSFGVAGDL